MQKEWNRFRFGEHKRPPCKSLWRFSHHVDDVGFAFIPFSIVFCGEKWNVLFALFHHPICCYNFVQPSLWRRKWISLKICVRLLHAPIFHLNIFIRRTAKFKPFPFRFWSASFIEFAPVFLSFARLIATRCCFGWWKTVSIAARLI